MMHPHITSIKQNFTAHVSPYHCSKMPEDVSVYATLPFTNRLCVPTFHCFQPRENTSVHKCRLSTTVGTENRRPSSSPCACGNNRGERNHKQTVKMGSEGQVMERKPRILCLHGFRTSGEILKTQLRKWPESVLDKIDLFFPDAPFPCLGKSGVEGIFDPPYYEWFQFNEELTDYINFDECVAYIEQCMIKHGPIDGLLGFSQGAILSAALPGLQAKGLALTKVPKIKLLIIISGAKLKNQSLIEKAYSSPIQCPSVHFIGETDFLKPRGIELLESVVDPVVIHHPKGHTIPRLDGKGLESMVTFLERSQKLVSSKEE